MTTERRGFDPYNLTPEEERARRALRQARDALAPAFVRGDLPERTAFEEFVAEQAQEIGDAFGGGKVRVADPDRFQRFLAGESDAFEESTGQPSPMRIALQKGQLQRARETGNRATTELPGGITLPFDLEVAAFMAGPALFGATPFLAGEVGLELATEAARRSDLPPELEGAVEGALAVAALRRGKLGPRAVAAGTGIGAGAGAVGGETATEIGAGVLGAGATDFVTGLGFARPTLGSGGRTATEPVEIVGGGARPSTVERGLAGQPERLTGRAPSGFVDQGDPSRLGEAARGAVGGLRRAPEQAVDAVRPRQTVFAATDDELRREPAFLDPRDATLEEVDEAVRRAGRSEHEMLVQALGSEDAARRFERLERRANASGLNFNPERADAAWREMESMLDNLTPEQQRLVFGDVSEPELSEEMLRELRRAVDISTFDDPQTLLTALRSRITRLTPERVQAVQSASRQQVAGPLFTDAVNVAGVREAVSGLRSLGLSDDQIFGGLANSLRQQGIEDADIDILIGPFLRGAAQSPPSATARQLPPAQPPRATVQAATEPPDEALRAAGQAVEPPIPAPQAARRASINEVRQQARVEPEAVPPQQARFAHEEIAAPDGGPPPAPPRRGTTGDLPPEEPSDLLQRAIESKLPEERLDQRLLRQHEAAISNAQRRAGVAVRDGNDSLIKAGLGTRRLGTVVPRDQADIDRFDNLLEALNEPSRVRAGELQVEPALQADFARLRELTDWEEAHRLDFDPEMATVEDYFYRGWRPRDEIRNASRNSQGQLVWPPGFTKPRVGALYREMRDAGFEPLFWNPYEQWRYSRMQGVRYRQQMKLVEALKQVGDDLIRPHDGGAIKAGWRVPEVGPAFEGKPFAAVDPVTGEAALGYSRRWIVRDEVANVLENMYGKKPSLGKVSVRVGPQGRFGGEADILKWVDFATFVPKRVGLFGTAFQQIDFLTRSGFGAFSNGVDLLIRGHPLQAAQAVMRYPVTAARILQANVSPAARQRILRSFDDTTPLIEGRSLSLKSITDEGLSIRDLTIFPEDMDVVLREAAAGNGLLRLRQVARLIKNLERAMRQGLFNGVYPEAIRTDVVNNIAPMMAKLYPNETDARLAARIARLANIKYSTIPASMSTVQNRFVREAGTRVLFSTNELEGLMRQLTNTIKGPDRRFWVSNWIGGYLFLMSVANLIHLATTQQPLPLERYVPISKDNFGPLPFGYNSRFATPDLPNVARGGQDAVIDIVGQMDTAFRILNPQQFVESRFSIPVRALVNQWSGENFFGRPINDVGPGGVVSRTVALALDLFTPFGAGPVAEEAARQTIPGADEVIPRGESRLGLGGLGIQALGINLRAANNTELEDALRREGISREEREAIRAELDRRAVESGRGRRVPVGPSRAR